MTLAEQWRLEVQEIGLKRGEKIGKILLQRVSVEFPIKMG